MESGGQPVTIGSVTKACCTGQRTTLSKDRLVGALIIHKGGSRTACLGTACLGSQPTGAGLHRYPGTKPRDVTSTSCFEPHPHPTHTLEQGLLGNGIQWSSISTSWDVMLHHPHRSAGSIGRKHQPGARYASTQGRNNPRRSTGTEGNPD
uniref:(northern house mosquito) hypothetical protein n=1 Tax=Culex pipiens TaxID=7175 RepID=A0A8D8CE93_CULPI